MNTIAITAYIVAWAFGLALALYYISRLKREAPAVHERIFKDEPKIRNDWRLLIFVAKGKFDSLPDSLRSFSQAFRFYLIGFFAMLSLAPILMK
jgi:hypothetical protein